MVSATFGHSLADISPMNPMRPAAWRWLRAQALVSDGKGPSRQHDDDPTRRAHRFWMHRASSEVESPHDLLDVRLAYDLYMSPEVGGGEWELNRGALRRAILEARLLAGQDSVQIARRLGCGTGGERLVDSYHDLFFDVRAHLEDGLDWIVAEAIGPALHHGCYRKETTADADAGGGYKPRKTDLTPYWKLVGYCMGPLALEAVLTVSPRRVVDDATQVARAIQDGTIAAVKAMSHRGAHTMQLSDSRTLSLIESFTQIFKTEKDHAEDQQRGDVLGAVQTTLTIMRPLFHAAGPESRPAIPSGASFPPIFSS